VVWVGLESSKPLVMQIVDDPLCVLSIGTQVARKPRDRPRSFGGDDGAEDLPPGAGHPESRDQPIAGSQKEAGELKQVEHEAGQGLAARRSLCRAFRTAFTHPELRARLSTYPSSAITHRTYSGRLQYLACARIEQTGAIGQEPPLN
jgi:hypothetical protein